MISPSTFTFGHKLLCPDDAQSAQKKLENQAPQKKVLDDQFPESVVTFTFQSDDDVPDEEETTDNDKVDKFKVLNDSWDDLTPETQATREKEMEEEAERLRMQEQEKNRAEEEAEKERIR